MELVRPDIKYKDSFIAALRDGFYLGSGAPMREDEIEAISNDFEGYLTNKVFGPYNPTPKLRDDGNYYPNVPQITYWLIVEGKFVGRFDLRTELNGFLMYTGGNVGYGITPSQRRRGYATKGLALLVEKARDAGMKKLLVAAKEDNIGSWRAIEKNGGVLENIIELPWSRDGVRFKRYWIEIS